MKKALACAAAALMMTGCFNTKIVFSEKGGGTVSAAHDGAWHHGIIVGLVTLSDPIAIDKVCPSGVAYVEQNTSFLNGLVGGITYNIYTPQTVSVYCADGGSADVKLDENGQVVAMSAIR